MDWSWEGLTKWIVAPSGLAAALAAWLLRRRRPSGSDSWLSRRLSAERDLMIARRTVASQEAEIAYLMGALERARESQEIVREATTTYALKSAKPSVASTPSPTGSRPPSDRSLETSNPPEIPSIS